MTNIKDVAKRAGVAVSTVSKYINGGSVRSYNEKAIKEAIEALDFKKNDVARALKTNKAMTVGILIPNLESLFFTTIVSHMEDKLHKQGYGIILCDYRNNVQFEKEKIDFLISKRVDGLIIVPHGEEELLSTVKKHKIPIVSIDRPYKGIDSVVTDSKNSAFEATEVFIKNRHKKIAVICGPKEVYTVDMRLKGYQEALKKHHIDENKCYNQCGNYTILGGYKAMNKLFEQAEKPTAVFVTNYEMTLGAVMAINERNVKVPDELSIIGFDDMDMMKVIRPPITVVSQPLKKLGEKAAEIILNKMKKEKTEQEKTFMLENRLIIRNSVKKMS